MMLWLNYFPCVRKRQLAPASASQLHQSQPALVSLDVSRRTGQRRPAPPSNSQQQLGPVSASQLASQLARPDRQTDRSGQPIEPAAASRIATQLTRRVGRQVAAAARLQPAVFFGALLCSTSPPAEARLTVYRRSQNTSAGSIGVPG